MGRCHWKEGKTMSNNSNIHTPYPDDASWAGLFEMAETYEEQEELPVYDNIEFFESPSAQDKQYDSPEEVLKALFGYDSFRAGQKEVIDSILAGRDAFAVMPTGAGKSVCYQVPAMLLSGITIVISPLISLMQDQVKSLNEAGVSAAFINSSLSEHAYFETVRKARQGVYKIIYVAPERLVTEGFLDLAENVKISMVTVDEAHCISQWGQDFRPSYMKIVEFVKMLKERPVISAFTATATETVREDIICTLGLQNPYFLVTGFDRENLFFQVDKPKNKEQYILDYISEHSGESGIIYCSTRKNVESVYDLLSSKGISVGKYHAGMSTTERKKMQDDFVFDYTSIVVATNAFGMGIDKSNVRFVIHYNMPQSMENYYQEAGRAGRDGLDSKCILLFSPQDIVINRGLLEHKEMPELDFADRQTVRERDMQRLQSMEGYCYTTECLRNYILKYFGENPKKPCEDCGNCLREFETLDMTDAAKKIINCVYEARGRYGKIIIMDTVLGAKTARLEEVGAIHYKSYGVLSDANKKLLRRLIEQMILEKYLVVGNYQVIKMGDISPLKDPETKVLVKITDEDKLPAKPEKAKKKSKGTESLTSAGYRLFDKLRALRLEIARKENMPPYIVFNDKTLIDMAVRVPSSRQEMLAVSGVGEHKYMKYGERFLAEIEAFVETCPELKQK
ncbi:DNA helicase RecQ [Roseburia zhanii]|nr:DNA helicase RecQ [Roseburia zhanii]